MDLDVPTEGPRSDASNQVKSGYHIKVQEGWMG